MEKQLTDSEMIPKPEAAADIVVITHFPSPYQIELFDEVERQAPGRLEVFYLHQTDRERVWKEMAMGHRAMFLENDMPSLAVARQHCQQARFVVFNFYADARVLALLNDRVNTGLPWCFWGERPGFIHNILGRLRRLWLLRALHRCRAAIWGIGVLAVAGYREEYGAHRQYVNLPYFSELQRFQRKEKELGPQTESKRIFLYSGSLITRKGVDLIASAFARLAREGLPVRLKIMGKGDLEKSLRQKLARCMDKVEFIGFRDWKDLPEVYAQADILCVPSRYDGWGLVVPEGLAAGLPTISSTQTGAAVEFIETGKNGWLVPPGDENALYLAMREAATLDSDSLHSMSQAAVASIKDHTLQAGASRFLRAVSEAIEMW